MNTTRAALAAAVASLPLVAVPLLAPASATPTPPPIAVEPLSPRSTFPDAVSMKLKIKHDQEGARVVHVPDLSRVVTARITVQPGARFPWHTHPGPVVVNVASGQLTYVDGDDCEEHVYRQGTAFTDTGGDVHSAYGSSAGPTVLIATFFSAPPAPAPLTVTEGVRAPDCS